MQVLSLDHVTINCTDIAKTKAFYEELFGLSRLEEVDLGDHVLHYYRLPGTRLELIEYKGEKPVVRTNNTDTGIYRHLALTVDDLESLQGICEKRGVVFNLEPTYIPQIGKTVMLIQDPNGVEVEVIQA